ncbi:hypothetical protein Tco_1259464, partial [Tanacetum coccineum]
IYGCEATEADAGEDTEAAKEATEQVIAYTDVEYEIL